MHLKYLIIGLVLGYILGTIVTYWYKKKFTKQQTLQMKLNQRENELNDYHEKLIHHCLNSAKVLNQLSQDYYQLYNSINTNNISDISNKHHIVNYSLINLENKELNHSPPKDYPENSSKILR